MQDGNEGRHEIIHQISPADGLISSWASQPTSIVNDLSVFALSFHLGFLLDVAMVGDVRKILRVLLDSEGLGIVSNLSKVMMWARFIGQSQLQFSPVSAFLSPSRIQRDTSRLTGALCFRRFSSAPASRLLLLPSLWGYVCEIKQRWKELSKRMRLYPSTIATSSATSMSETSRFKATKEREQNILHAHCAIFMLRLFMMQLKPPSIVNSRWWWQVGLCYAFTLNGFGKQRRTFVNTTTRALCPETSRRRHSKCF